MNNLDPTFIVGMTAVEVVEEIIRVNPEIKNLSFYVYVPKYNISELHESKRKGLLISRLLIHDSTKETIRLSRNEITTGNLAEIIRKFEKESVISVLSKVRTRRGIYHIPMMDFDRPNHIQKIKQLLRIISQKHGVIMFSGRSYHYYGARLMNEAEWLNFLGDCILSGLVDVRYVGHRLKDRCSNLRLSTCPLRPQMPKVLAVITT